jgi:hypothetical protein
MQGSDFVAPCCCSVWVRSGQCQSPMLEGKVPCSSDYTIEDNYNLDAHQKTVQRR